MPGALLKFVKSVDVARWLFDFNQRFPPPTRWKEHNCRETVSGMRSVIEQLLVQLIAELARASLESQDERKEQ